MHAVKPFLDKQGAITLLLLLMLVPWFRGGREPIAMAVLYGEFILALYLLWQLPGRLEFRWSLAHRSGLVLLGWAVLSLWWSINRFQTGSWIVVLVIAAGAYLAAYLAFQRPDIRRMWINGYIWLTTILSLLGIWMYLTQDYERLTSWFYWANPMAAFLLPAILLSLRAVLARSSWFRAALSTILLAAFWLSDSRTAILTLIVVIGLGWAFFSLKKSNWIKLLLIFIASVGLSLILGFVKQQLQAAPVVLPGVRFEEALKGESQSGSDRWNYIKSSLAIWRDYPWLGTGAGTFGSAHPGYQQRVVSAASDPHNFYLKILSEQGVIGLVLLVLFVLGVLAAGIRSWWGGHMPIAAWLGLLALTLHIGLEIDLSFPVLVMLFAQLTAMASASLAQKPIAKNTRLILPIFAIIAGLLVIAWYKPHQNATSAELAQGNNNYLRAANYYADSHSGLIYDPDWITRAGINYYTYALASKNKPEYLFLAEQKARQAAKLDRLDAQHHFLLARIHRARNQYHQAINEYQEAIRLDPLNQPEYYLDLAHYFYVKSQLQPALEVANKGLALYTDGVILNRSADQTVASQVSGLYLVRGQIYLSLNNVAAAKADFKKALAVDGANRAAREQLQLLP